MNIELRPLTEADVEAHMAGEDADMIRWLNGGPSTRETTLRHVAELAAHREAGSGKRGFGVWLDGSLAGYIDASPESEHGQEPGDVTIAYGVHPWARGRGVAVRAVALICEFIQREAMGTAALIAVEPENRPSIRVAEKAGFTRVEPAASPHHTENGAASPTHVVFRLPLSPGLTSGGATTGGERVIPPRDDCHALREHWDNRYAMTPRSELFTADPNEFLVQHAAKIPRGGSVLCIADGQGRNSRWLAQQGFRVTAVDLSPVAVADARRLSADAGVHVDHYCADLAKWILTPDAHGPWDAVVAISSYWALHDARRSVHHALGQRLAPGGLLIIEVSLAVTDADLVRTEWGPHLNWEFSQRRVNGNDQLGALAVSPPDGGALRLGPGHGVRWRQSDSSL